LFATERKGSDCIEKSVEYLKQKEVQLVDIEHVCIDISPAFIFGCQQYLPDSSITFDKFTSMLFIFNDLSACYTSHVVKEVNKAMDELR